MRDFVPHCATLGPSPPRLKQQRWLCSITLRRAILSSPCATTRRDEHFKIYTGGRYAGVVYPRRSDGHLEGDVGDEKSQLLDPHRSLPAASY